ncbi:hypothetical protein PAXINDRAFT_6310 [Paxillus involutus ATCC 200175]|nr:hypothetical protein PAXINDRAFT_6310 [Paxillus involutus ATCC 200175]
MDLVEGLTRSRSAPPVLGLIDIDDRQEDKFFRPELDGVLHADPADSRHGELCPELRIEITKPAADSELHPSIGLPFFKGKERVTLTFTPTTSTLDADSVLLAKSNRDGENKRPGYEGFLFCFFRSAVAKISEPATA